MGAFIEIPSPVILLIKIKNAFIWSLSEDFVIAQLSTVSKEFRLYNFPCNALQVLFNCATTTAGITSKERYYQEVILTNPPW